MTRKYSRGYFSKLAEEGKLKIKFASTKEVSAYEDIATDFFNKIFGMEEGSYMISDESSVWDFRSRKNESKETLVARIEESYGVKISDIKDGNLVSIFRRIEWERKPSC